MFLHMTPELVGSRKQKHITCTKLQEISLFIFSLRSNECTDAIIEFTFPYSDRYRYDAVAEYILTQGDKYVILLYL
jgi:hypothetical protein